MKKIILSLVIAISISPIFAQTPQALNYQAVARNASGIVLPNKAISLRISIHNATPTGSVVYQETFTPTTNKLGLFTLNIGTGAPVSGTFSGINWASGSKYMQVEMDSLAGSNYADLGTTQLLSVPYALYAANSGNNFQAGNGIKISNDSIINTNPDQTVTITGSGTSKITGSYPNFNVHSDSAQNNSSIWNANRLQGNSVSGLTPTDKQVLKWNSTTGKWTPGTDSSISYSAGSGLSLSGTTFNSDWTTTGSNISNNNTGNVGIGKSPAYSLDVKGPANADSLMIGNITMISTKGSKNILIGQNAGSKNSGIDNHFEGYQAGYSNNTAHNNLFVGYQAGYSNTVGSNNHFEGYHAGYSNTSGYSNYFSGNSAGYSNTTGSQNLFISDSTGYANTTGSDNVLIGSGVGNFISTESNNLIVGALAGNRGSNNVMLGFESGYRNKADNNHFIGYLTGYKNSTGYSNQFEGNSAGYSTTTGYQNLFVGDSSGYSNNTGYQNTIIGSNANVSSSGLHNALALGYGSAVNASNTMAFGNSSVVGWVFGRTSVSNSGYALQVGNASTNGNGAYLTTGGAWTNASDRNKKENFTSLNSKLILDKICALPITQWNYKGSKTSNTHIGPMAQDFYKLFHTGDDSLAISSIDPAGVALIGVQELKKENEILQKENDALRLQVEKLNKENASIKGTTDQLVKEVAEIKSAIKSSNSGVATTNISER